MIKYEIRTNSMIVAPKDGFIFSDSSTRIRICDDGAGEYLEISQFNDLESGIQLDKDNWPLIKEAIDKMINECKEDRL